MKKTSNKKIKSLIPKPDGNYFFDAGSLLGNQTQSSFMTNGIPQTFNTKINHSLDFSLMGEKKGLANPNALNIDKNNLGKSSLVNSKTTTTTPQAPGIGAYLGIAQGAMQIGNQAINNLSTEGIGSEVVNTKDMSRDDILNTNVNVDSKQTNVGSAALSGAMSGAQAGMAFGPLGAAIGGGVGLLAGGISSTVGNNKKQQVANLAEQQWTNNLQAKNRQFQQQDMRNSMANFSAEGGNLYAYGGNQPNALIEFNEGGKHESNVNGGILQGTGANGKPNLVEEGETKHENYIFSDRLKINKQTAKLNGLPVNTVGKTFANASKILNKEAKERPNDPISMNAVKADLSKLTQAQEMIKAKKQAKEQPQENPQANMLAQGYANGGDLFMHDNVFANGGGQTHYRNPIMTSAANVYSKGGTKSRILDADGYIKDANNDFIKANDYAMYIDEPSINGSNIPSGRYAYAGRVKERDDYNFSIPFGYPGTEDDNKKAIEIDNRYKNNSYNPLFKPQPPKAGVLNQGNPNQKAVTDAALTDIKKHGIIGRDENGRIINNDNSNISGFFNKLSQIKGQDYSRYAPVAANVITGISDMFEKPEVVKFSRINPEQVTARMDYQPIDTEWMSNKMKGQAAGMRDSILNTSGGNRAIAMAGLSGINRQSQEALGQQYLQSQDINYGRKNQALQFNAGIEAQNVAARNAAQAQNVQLAMQEADLNARNRAAKRNAARQAILQASQDLGGIGRENWAAKTGESMFGYKTDAQGNITYKK